MRRNSKNVPHNVDVLTDCMRRVADAKTHLKVEAQLREFNALRDLDYTAGFKVDQS